MLTKDERIVVDILMERETTSLLTKPVMLSTMLCLASGTPWQRGMT